MKSFEQLAETACMAYVKKAREIDSALVDELPASWNELDADTKACWIAAAKQVAADIAALH